MGSGNRIVTGICWVEARDTAERFTLHRTVPTTKSHMLQNISGSEAEKPSTKQASAAGGKAGVELLTDLDHQKEIGLLFHNRC